MPRVQKNPELENYFFSLVDPPEKHHPKEMCLLDRYDRQLKTLTDILKLQENASFHSLMPYARNGSRSIKGSSFDEAGYAADWKQFLQNLPAGPDHSTRRIEQVRAKFAGQDELFSSWRAAIRKSVAEIPDVFREARFEELGGVPFHLGMVPSSHPILISYFFKDCPPCLEEIETVMRESTHGRPATFVFINVMEEDDSRSIVEALTSKGLDPDAFPANVHIVHDTDRTYRKIIPRNLLVAPLSFVLLPRNRRLIDSHVGFDLWWLERFNSQ